MNQLIEFDVPQLSRFIDHPGNLKRSTSSFIKFLPDRISFSAGTIYPPKSIEFYTEHIAISILCEGMDWQVSHLTLALSRMSAVFSNLAHFTICSGSSWLRPKPEDMDDIEWPQLLSLFSSVRTLFVTREFSGHVSRALENIAGVATTEVLPAMDLLCLEDQPMSSIRRFITDRQDSGRPLTVVNTRWEYEERQKSRP